jgi:flagellar hook-length control protein FliK
MGDIFTARNNDIIKDVLGAPERLQNQASLAVENYVKSSAFAPTITTIDGLPITAYVATPLLNPVTPSSEALQRTQAAQTVINAQPQRGTTPPALQIVSDNLIKAMISQSGVSMRLDPPEMGNVQINFQFDAERGVTAVVRSELADTSSFLREQAEHLQQALKDSGFDSVNLSFEQGAQSDQDQNNTRDDYSETHFTVDQDLSFKAQNLGLQVRGSGMIVGDHPVDIKL